ncbi:hypothetical protein LTR51_008653 [Lithohypha guttulata]|nr:hypothetical protein LTR51_008653 [Lithohypha guttulata]
MSIFTESTTDAHMSSVYDTGFDQSDMDTSASDHTCDEDPPKDYWFGRKYFDCVMAQNVLQHSRLYESIAQSRLEKALQKFPYAQSLTELRAEGLEPLLPMVEGDLEHDAYRVMMLCIGAIVRKGDRRQKAALLAVLRGQGGPVENSGVSQPRSSTTQHEGRTRRYPRKVEHFVGDVSIAASELGRYATALKEHSDKHGLVPTYKVDEVSKIPPHFRAFVMVDGSTYTGTAKTKKQARHEAAKEACLEMDIDA